MTDASWKKVLKESADAQRALHHFELLKAAGAAQILKSAEKEEARVWSALFAGSQSLNQLLIKHPDLLGQNLRIAQLEFPRQAQGLSRQLNDAIQSSLVTNDYGSALSAIREFKQRESLRIAARDLGRLGTTIEIVGELSNVADTCLDAVYRVCFRRQAEKLGQPWQQDADGKWQPAACAVIGLGKLGGQELNYSSDVDVIFVYSDEGSVFRDRPRSGSDAGKTISAHQFYNRLAEQFIAEVSRFTPEGFLYRIDLRLRPEGDMGPLSRALSAYENFYAQFGQTWERLMLIKGRCVAGDAHVASEFFELIQPFRYPRSPGPHMIEEISAMKARIETDVVKSGELDRDVKRGRGGIREIEFFVQSFQLLHAGKIPFLQGAQTLPILEKLVDYNLIESSDARALAKAYCFHRDVEHRLQMEDDQQTHTIPASPAARKRLARLMNFASTEAFEKARKSYCDTVRGIYEKVFGAVAVKKKPILPGDFSESETQWNEVLQRHLFRDPEKGFYAMRTFVQGPGFGHVSSRTGELGMQLIERLLEMCPQKDRNADSRQSGSDSAVSQTSSLHSQHSSEFLSDPDRVLARLERYVEVYGARSLLYESWVSNPSLFRLLILLFDRSEFLAEVAIQTPDLVDELELSGRLRRSKSASDILSDLRHGKNDADQSAWMRRYHQAEQMRIGLRDILGLVDFEKNLLELSALAEACLCYAFEVVLRKHKLRKAPFAIIGLGKLGGSELNFGSDLDILFVAPDSSKKLSELQKLAVEIIDLLSKRTEFGTLFHVDTRLRPDGEKGLLVNTLSAIDDYYHRRAHLWEIQALTRTRPIAGDLVTGEKFQNVAGTLTRFGLDNVLLLSPGGGGGEGVGVSRIAAFTPDWKKEIARMRTRIEKERTAPGKDHLAIKTGVGGLMDAEFIAQTACLANNWQLANTLEALKLVREHHLLPEPLAESLIENYRKLRRIEGILRRWSFEGETTLPENAPAQYRVAVRCGFDTAEEFLNAVADYRRSIRAAYERFFA